MSYIPKSELVRIIQLRNESAAKIELNRWIWEHCTDRPDFLVSILDEYAGWEDKGRRLFVCDCAKRALRRHGLPLDIVNVAEKFALGFSGSDRLTEARKQARELYDKAGVVSGAKSPLLYLIWCTFKDPNEAVNRAVQEALDNDAFDAKAIEIACRHVMHAKGPSEQADAAEWADAAGEKTTECYHQCDWLKSRVGMPKVLMEAE